MTRSSDFELLDLVAKPQAAARWILRVSFIGFVSLLVWAHWAEIDQITRAQGQVIARARTQTVQAAEGGVLKKLLVKEGETVRKGQVLGILERGRMQAAVNDSQAKVAALRITLARLNAEVYGNALQFPPALQKYPDYIQNQKALFAQRQLALNEEVGALSRSLDLAKEELAMHQPLLEAGDVSKADILRFQRQVSDIQSQITNKRNKYFQDAQAEMTKTQEELRTTLGQNATAWAYGAHRARRRNCKKHQDPHRRRCAEAHRRAPANFTDHWRAHSRGKAKTR
jgi:membrane fusion protein, adhesin transport system